MLTRFFSMLAIILMVSGLAIGQNTDTEGKSLSDEAQKIVNPIPEKPDKPASPPEGPMVLISPNGGEKWNEGTIQTIEWNVRAKVNVDSVQIRLIEDVGMKTVIPRTFTLSVVRGNPGKWVWEGVTPPLDLCKIEVHAFAREKILLIDESDASFTIIRDLVPLDDPKKNVESKDINGATEKQE